MRLPGGRIAPEQLELLAALAGEESLRLGNHGELVLPAGLDAIDATSALTAAGLRTQLHPRSRAIAASPLVESLSTLAGELDAALAARTSLDALPDSFVFALDDRLDVAALDADIEIRSGIVHLGAHPTDIPATVGSLVDAAEEFVLLRADEDHVRDLPNGANRIAARLSAHVTGDRFVPAATAPPIGWLDQPDGSVTLSAAVVDGELTGRLAALIAAIGAPVVFTPWRTIVIPGMAEGPAETVVRVLAPMGLVFDADSPHIAGERGHDGPNSTH